MHNFEAIYCAELVFLFNQFICRDEEAMKIPGFDRKTWLVLAGVGTTLICCLYLTHIVFLNKEQAQTERQHGLERLSLRASQLSYKNPSVYIFNPDVGNKFKHNGSALLESIQLLKYDADGVSNFWQNSLPQQFKTLLNTVVQSHAHISKSQTEFMQLRSQRDALHIKLTELIDSTATIIASMKSESGADIANLANLVELKLVLGVLDQQARSFWSSISSKSEYLNNAENLFKKAEQLSGDLLHENNGLTLSAHRREMLFIVNKIAQFSVHLDAMEKALNRFQEITTHQHKINRAIDRITKIDSIDLPESPNNRLFFAITAFIVSASLLVVMRSIPKETPTSPLQQNVLNQTKNRTDTATTQDFEGLIQTIELTAKGNLSSRADERPGITRDVASAYNNMTSSIYRRIISIYRDTQELKKILVQLNGHENSSRHDSKSTNENNVDSLIQDTLEIAGIVDQLHRKTIENIHAGESIESLLSRLDKRQALIRAKIKASQEHEEPTKETSTTDETTGYKQLVEVVGRLEGQLSFFNLNRRR